jgi:hypothetical protein
VGEGLVAVVVVVVVVVEDDDVAVDNATAESLSVLCQLI